MSPGSRSRWRDATGSENAREMATDLAFEHCDLPCLVWSQVSFLLAIGKVPRNQGFPKVFFFGHFLIPLYCSACSTCWFLRLERSSTLAFTIFEFALWQVLAERCSFSPNHQERIPENYCLYLIMSYYDLQHIFDFIHLICNHHLSIVQFNEKPTPLHPPQQKTVSRIQRKLRFFIGLSGGFLSQVGTCGAELFTIATHHEDTKLISSFFFYLAWCR